MASVYEVALAAHRKHRSALRTARARAKQYISKAIYGKKNVICDEIVELIQESGGRFLKHKNSSNPMDGWENVSQDVAREKVSHSFRTKKKTTKMT